MPKLINENGYILQATEESTAALLSAVKTPSVTLNPGTDISEDHFSSLGLAYDISDNKVKCLQMNADGKLLCDVGNLTLNTGALSVDNSGVETGLSTVNTTLLGNLKIINGTNGSGDIPLTVTDSSLTGALNVTPLVASDNFTRNAIFASDPSTGRARIVECDNSGKLQVGVTGSVTATLSTIDNEAIDAITTAVSVGNVIAGTNSVSTGLASNVAHTKTVVVGVNSNNEGTPIKVDTDGKLITKSDPQSTTSALTAINTLIDRTVMVGHFPDNNTGVPLKVDGTGILQIAGTVELGTTDNTVLDTIAGDTTSLDDKISKGADVTLAGAQQTVIYGQDSVTPTTLRALKTDTSGNLQVDVVAGAVTATLSTDDHDAIGAINDSIQIGVDTGITPSTPTSIVGKIAGNVSHQRSVMIGVDNSDNSAPEGVPLSVDGDGVLNVATDFTSGNQSELTESKQVAVYGLKNGGGGVRMLELDDSGRLKISNTASSGPIDDTPAHADNFTRQAIFASDGNNAMVVKCDSSGKLEVDANITAGNITGFNLESTQTAMSAKLPLALSGSGNLKVSIEEGATPAITGFNLESTQTAMSAKLPATLDSGNLKVAIQSGATPAITGFNLESTQTAMSAKLPATLDSGNLKVAIQSGATPAITGFNLESTQTAMSAKLPATLDSGNLKVAIQSGATPAITGFNLESTQTAMSGKISKGADVTLAGAQQTVIYGRDYSASPAILRALKIDSSGNLQVDVVSGAVTATLSATDNAVLDTIAGDTNSLDDKISKGAGATIDAATGAQQVLIYGIDSTNNLRGVQVDGTGRIKTYTASVGTGSINSTIAITNSFSRTALFASNGTHARVVNCSANGNLEVDISEALPTGTNKIGSVGLVANTVQDGTGTEKNLVCDTNGKLLVSIPDEDYQQYPAIVTTVPSTDIITSVPVVNIPRYFTYSTLFSAITESHSQSYDDNTQGFTNTIVTTGFTKISVVGKITNTFPDELSNVLRVELWPVFSSSPSEDHADNMIGPVASGLFIKDYLYFDTVELLYPYVKLRVVNEGISDAVLNLRVYMRK